MGILRRRGRCCCWFLSSCGTWDSSLDLGVSADRLRGGRCTLAVQILQVPLFLVACKFLPVFSFGPASPVLEALEREVLLEYLMFGCPNFTYPSKRSTFVGIAIPQLIQTVVLYDFVLIARHLLYI